MSRFKIGDLVRYIRGREGAATRSLRRPEHIEWRDRRIGLILRDAGKAHPTGNWTATVMYYVIWSDTDEPQLIPEWNLEFVPEEG